MDYEFWLEKAKVNIEKMPPTHIFLAKDLFVGSEWLTLKRGERLSFGKYFKNAVLEGEIPGVEYIGKANNNSAQYKKWR